jgi:hypothetical protein
MPPPSLAAASRRFAYALLEPPAASPGFVLRRALEERGGNPCVALAASDYGALLAIFATPEAREATMALFPLSFDGHDIRLERPEEGCNRFVWSFTRLVQVSATGFPLEHWDEAGIRAAFRPIGDVCCIDPLCLHELDFSAVRLVLKLAEGGEVPHTLLVRECHGGSSAEVLLRSVQCWPYDDALASMPFAHFDNPGGDHASPPTGGTAHRVSRMDDIDVDSVMGAPPPSPPRLDGRGRPNPVVELWQRIVARRQAGMARAAALDDIDGVPPALGSHSPSLSQQVTPTELWDRVLSRRLAEQLPESGLDAEQVTSAPLPSSSLCLNLDRPSKPLVLLLQWYETLAIPATPLVPEDMTGGSGADAGLDGDHVEPPPALPFSVIDSAADVHEDAARKQRVRRKRAVDSAFKARRSSRLAAKEPDNFVNMLTKAKLVKASRFDFSGGSPRLRAAATAAGFAADDVPGPIPLPRLRALAAACGVDPDAVEAGGLVPSGLP